MLSDIFLWFYRLDLVDAILLMLLATGVFCRLNGHFARRRFRRIVIGALLLLWGVVVVRMTVLNRGLDPAAQGGSWIPFHSYWLVFHGGNRELLRSNLMNVLLFYPGGLLAAALLPKPRKPWRKALLIAVGCCALSAAIELTQHFGHLGLGETDDVIHNTLGAFLGAMMCAIPVPAQLRP